MTDFFDFWLNLTNHALRLIGDVMLEANDIENAMYGINYMTFASAYEPIFRAFAYAFCLLFIGVNIMESALQYELFSMKGALKIAARLLLAKIWIDLSVTICGYIIEIGASMTREVLKGVGADSLAFPLSDIGALTGVDGGIFDALIGVLNLIPLAIVLIVVFVIGFCVIIKIVMRTFELAMLISVSPIFFACMVGDSTKSYFRKFITTFLGVVMQLVFMALVYAITASWLAQRTSVSSGADMMSWFISAVPWLLTFIAMGIMMIRPPKILTSLIS